MAAAANSPEFRKKVGISKDVATEFHNADRKKARFQEGGEVRDRQRSSEGRTIIREPGREPRVYDPYEDLRRKYQTPGTVIRGDELPNSRPTSRPNMEENRVKRMAKGGKAGCGHGMMGGGKVKRYAEGGKVDDREVIDFTGEELVDLERTSKSGPGGRGKAAADAYMNQVKKRKFQSTADDAAAVMRGFTPRGVPMHAGRRGEETRAFREQAYSGDKKRTAFAAGGQVCRGMGAAVRGGKYKS